MMCAQWYAPSRQRGAVLIVALVLLAVLALVGTVSMAVTTVETRIVTNTSDRQAAMVMAESALVIGENALLASSKPDTLTAFDGSLSGDWWRTRTDSYWDNKGVANVTGGAKARYVIEQGATLSGEPNVAVSDLGLGYIKPRYVAYRVTARGTGQGGSRVYLQSVFIRKQHSNAP